MAYMYYPYMRYAQNPQFYNGGSGYGQYPAYPQAYPYMYGNPDESVTETDLSDAEIVKSGKAQAQSDLSKAEKAEMLEEAYEAQQKEMAELHRRMSQMQASYSKQISQMRESQEAFKTQLMQARSARTETMSEKKPMS